MNTCIIHTRVRITVGSSVRPSVTKLTYHGYMHHTHMQHSQVSRIMDVCIIDICMMIKEHIYMHPTYMHHMVAPQNEPRSPK